MRKVADLPYVRERIATPDDDRLLLDWSRVGAKRLVIISHGLEGHSRRSYVQGMAAAVNRRGWDALAWNMRGCGGRMNRQLRLYHSGVSQDLDVVVKHVIDGGLYEEIALVGFSLGGNVTLKYLGEERERPANVLAGVGISVPCDLAGSGRVMEHWTSRIYMRQFLLSLRRKIEFKIRQFPGALDLDGYESIRTFRQFDDRYTAPLHGMADADDYYRTCSSIHFLKDIKIPALLLNSADDPFLSPECFPRELARTHKWLHLEIPRHGGHVGFVGRPLNGENWIEARVCSFLESLFR